MVIFDDTYCQICDRFYTKEQWNNHLYSSRPLHREVNGYWLAFFPHRKLTRDEGNKLEKAFWEVILTSNDNDLALFEFLKLYFRMCTNMTDHVPVRYWDYYDDRNEEEQWGYGYRDDMIAQFKQDLYNKNFTLQDQSRDDPIVTLGNRIKIWLKIINNDEGPVPDNNYDYDYNDERLDHSVRGWDRNEFPEIRELKNLLDILRSK